MRNLELSAASNADELWEERKQMLADGKNETGGDLRSKYSFSSEAKSRRELR